MKKLKADLFIGIIFLLGIVGFYFYSMSKYSPDVAATMLFKGAGIGIAALAVYWILTLKLRK